MARPKGHSSEMICADCKYVYTNEESERALGIKRVVEIINGEKVDSYENIGDKFSLFPSWYCLKFFKTGEQRRKHDALYHKVGDPMIGMTQSGMPVEFVATCGNEDVVA